MKSYILPMVILLLLFSFCKEQNSLKEGSGNKAYEVTIRNTFNSFVEQAWNDGNMDSLHQVIAENYEKHLNGIRITTNAREMEANMNIYFKGFPDGNVVVDDIKVNDDSLYANWTYTGTNTGEFGEYPPTGKKITVKGHSTVQFNAAGKMIREQVYYNELELLQQLGFTLKPPVVE